MDSIPDLSRSSCHSVSQGYECELVPLTKGWWRWCFTKHKDTKNIIQPGHKGGQCPLRVRRTVTCLCLWLRLWISSTIISTYQLIFIAVIKHLLRQDKLCNPSVVFVPYHTSSFTALRKHVCAKKDPFITKTHVRLPHSLTLPFSQIKYSHTIRKI